MDVSNDLGNSEASVGRPRSTTRLTTQDCWQVRMTDFTRCHALTADPGTWGSYIWRDSSGKVMRKIAFSLTSDHLGRLAVCFYHLFPNTAATHGSPVRQIIEISPTICNFGGVRPWFTCPAVKNGVRCERRAAILYATPCDRLFACRECRNLTFESSQRHDKRLDALVELPFEQFEQVFFNGNAAEQLLASRAIPLLRRKLERKLAKYGRSLRSTP
jgi:hypothetical protein